MEVPIKKKKREYKGVLSCGTRNEVTGDNYQKIKKSKKRSKIDFTVLLIHIVIYIYFIK